MAKLPIEYHSVWPDEIDPTKCYICFEDIWMMKDGPTRSLTYYVHLSLIDELADQIV